MTKENKQLLVWWICSACTMIGILFLVYIFVEEIINLLISFVLSVLAVITVVAITYLIAECCQILFYGIYIFIKSWKR